MIIVTTNDIPGKEIKETLGMVRGSTIRAKHIGKDITSSFRQMIGGEMTEYSNMLTEARQIATDRMVKEAQKNGANAIVSVRYTTSSVMQGAAEILAYGTAVIIE